MKRVLSILAISIMVLSSNAQILGISDKGYSLMDANWTMLGFFPSTAEDAEAQTTTRYFCQYTAPNTAPNTYTTWKLGTATLAQKNYQTSNTVKYLTAGSKVLDPTSSTGDYTNAGIGLMKMVLHYNGESTPDMKEISSITEFPVVFGSAKVSTLMLPVAATIPSGVRAYTLTYENEALKATPVSSQIPARTPVLLNADEARSYIFSLSIPENPVFAPAEIITENNHRHVIDAQYGVLYGVFQPHFVPLNSYVLQNGKEGVGFYKMTSSDNYGSNYSINAFRCYVTLPDVGAHSLSIVFDDSETTGIADVKGKKEDVRGDIFNLSGQRVGKDYKGVVIKNGRKMIQK